MLRAAKKLPENTPAKFVHTDSRGPMAHDDRDRNLRMARRPLYTVIDNADEYAAATQHARAAAAQTRGLAISK